MTSKEVIAMDKEVTNKLSSIDKCQMCMLGHYQFGCSMDVGVNVDPINNTLNSDMRRVIDNE